MTKLTEPCWTVVQHSGYRNGENPFFERDLESVMLSTAGEIEKVVKAGGLIFDNYNEAEDYAFKETSSDENIIGNAPGVFSNLEIDGLKIYVPARRIDNA